MGGRIRDEKRAKRWERKRVLDGDVEGCAVSWNVSLVVRRWRVEIRSLSVKLEFRGILCLFCAFFVRHPPTRRIGLVKIKNKTEKGRGPKGRPFLRTWAIKIWRNTAIETWLQIYKPSIVKNAYKFSYQNNSWKHFVHNAKGKIQKKKKLTFFKCAKMDQTG